MTELSASATFLWGALGGLAGYAVAFLLPWMSQLARGEIQLEVTWGRLLGLFGVMSMYVGLGGVAAVLVGDALEVKHALAYGLGFEGILKGAIEVRSSSA